ncbi:MAG: hypothetical protein IKZ96_03045 [Bacilli bacterium]|nr:hypothetical protein [Bacilli bacterium]
MKNIKGKKLLFTFILLLMVIIPVTITFGKFEYASPIQFDNLQGAAAQTITGTYRFSNGSVGAYYIYGADKIPAFCITSSVCRGAESKFWMGEAVTGTGTNHQRFYHTYCLQSGLTANGKPDGISRPYLTAHVYNDHFDNNTLKNKAGNYINANQRELLEDVLASGYHYSENHTQTVYNLSNGDHVKRIFVKQLIVWEIVEGARTNLDEVPNVYHANNSGYYAVITKKTNLHNIYKDQLAAAREYREKRQTGAPIFGKEYTMRWNNSISKYESVISESLNGFSNCSANNNDVSVSTKTTTTGTETIVTSTKAITTPVTITCSYVVGDGSSQYTYFTFTKYTQFQNLVYGIGGTTIKKSFTVRSEASNVYINKYNESGQRINNADFTLTLKSDPSISFALTGNKTTQVIEKSGLYTLRETNPPHGYDKISEVELNIDIKNGTITSSNSAIQVLYDSASNTFYITVVDKEKSFEIKKVNESNAEVKGATFKIYNGNNFSNEVKFNKANNIFNYAENGTVTNIVDNNYSTYSIRFLPKGIYRVEETATPMPYLLPTDINDRTFYIKVEDEYNVFDCGTDSTCKNPKLTVNSSITIKNYESRIEIIKTGTGGLPLGGVKFVLLNEDKTKYITSDYLANEYFYSTSVTDITNATVFITNTDGKIIIHNLPMGTYYLKEIETIDPYVLPEGDAVYTKLVLEMKKDGLKLNGKSSKSESISNASKEFNFYKVDENGNYLAGGKFKIQRFNDDTGKYEDIKLVSVENDGTYQANANIFKEDSESGKVQFTLAHGIATFVDMTPGTTYRILELEAPKGYEVANVDNSAIIRLDRNGYAKGSAIIINQLKKIEGSTAQAELIIEIQTGRKLIRYGLIIAGTLILIAGLMVTLIYVSKKRK